MAATLNKSGILVQKSEQIGEKFTARLVTRLSPGKYRVAQPVFVVTVFEVFTGVSTARPLYELGQRWQ